VKHRFAGSVAIHQVAGSAAKHRIGVAVALALFGGCASPGVPPGGPVDALAPQLLRIAPDSGRTGTTPREVIFRFDEVVSERPAGATSLEALFLISPRGGSPRVDWNRDEVAVRPQRGWRSNTTYTVTLLPGVSDLRGNVRTSGATTVFTTGVAIPQSRISGTVFNWAAGSVAPRALVEATADTDTTLVFVTLADSAGRFAFPHLAPGAYLVRGVLDENSNRGLDPRELWDSATVVLADTARLELLAFVHDSAGARLTDVTVRDSVTLIINFDTPISIAALPPRTSFTITASDSSRVPVLRVDPQPTPVDSVTARGARPSRPVPSRTLILALGAPVRAGTTYRVRAADIRNLSGVVRSSEQQLSIPVPPPPPPRPPATTPVRSRPDSARAVPLPGRR